MIRLNNDWEFTTEWTGGFALGEGAFTGVRLPHTVRELPLHYIDPGDYQMVSGYRRHVSLTREDLAGRVFLQFDGAAHVATVYVNGRELMTHRCGYTAFRADITELAHAGDNLVAVRLDSTEDPSVPPFGFVLDYLTYGGLYRDVWLDIRPKKYISDLFVHTPELTELRIACRAGLGEGDLIRFDILDMDGAVKLSFQTRPGCPRARCRAQALSPWTLDDPVLYRCRATIVEDGADIDSVETTFGVRTADFRADGFYLNGQKVFLRGLNRHQSYPYVGYAVPERLQREDARILKRELSLNAVRTSHYPQSQYFIDECDREGLLVFTEIPGWQHVGDQAWQDQACENTREMVLQYRNHPSVILWGVRINESLDYDEFYARTNEIAHSLDPSRATSGVRYLQKSSLLEDVYAYNDFSHSGGDVWARPKGDVCPDPDKAFLISECNGHMYPTKPSDPWSMRQEQALRHARVLDEAMYDGGHVGFFAWCMFDYATHPDFGSGDRICYHGVMDSFRNPKLAAAFYASQGDGEPVLEIGSSTDIGDYPGGATGPISIFTNADAVNVYRGGDLVSTLGPDRCWRALPHGPITLEDMIGKLIETREGFPADKAGAIRDCLNAAKKYGFDKLPPKERARLTSVMAKYHLTMDDMNSLFREYVANWGGSARLWRFDAVKDGRVTASVTRCPAAGLHLDVRVSHTRLFEGEVYDMAAVRIRLLDGNGQLASYAQLPVTFALEGQAALVGPSCVCLEGGSAGTYIRTVGRAGDADLTISTPQTPSVTVSFTVDKD